MSVFEGIAPAARRSPARRSSLTIIRGNAADPHEVAARAREAARDVRLGPPDRGTPTDTAPATTSGEAPMLTPETGYVRIAGFGNGIADELSKKVADLSKAARSRSSSTFAAPPKGRSRTGSRRHGSSSSRARSSIRAGRDGQNKETFEAKPGDGAIDAARAGCSSRPARREPRSCSPPRCDDNKRARSDRRTHARPRRPPEAGEAAGRPRPLAHLRAVLPIATTGGGQAQQQKPPTASTPDIGTGGRPNAPKIPGAEAINGKGLQPDVNVEEPDVAEFGSKATLTTIRSSTPRSIGFGRRPRSRGAVGRPIDSTSAALLN